MKKATLILLIISASFAAQSQTVTQDKNGNFTQVRKVEAAPADSTTGKTFTDYNKAVYPVYKNSKGKLYIIRTSAKTGNRYRYYFTIQS